MSVLAAILRRDGRPVDAGELERMLEASASAAPDGRGAWREGAVGLAHGLLAATPESRAERQPFRLGDLRIAADARVDNRAELAPALAADDPAFDAAAATDDEYILRAYRLWGLDCLPRLLGDFAFAVWDGPARRLVCARDCFGVRPLYYSADARRLLVASEIRQVLADPDVPRALDDEVVEDWLTLGHRKQLDATYFKAIRQVPAGHLLVAAGGGEARVSRWWRWRQPKPVRYRDDREYVEHVRELLERAVAARLRAVGPVGLMLSGGLDSSSVAGVAADLLRRDGRGARSLVGYSFVYDEARSADERDFIEPLVEAVGCTSVYLYPERHEPFSRAWQADEPDSSDAYDPTWTEALEDLRDRGGRVMLTGFGGETLFLSQSDDHFVDWLLSGRWRTLARELRGYRERGRRPRVRPKRLAARLVPQAVYERLPVREGNYGEPPWIAVTPENRGRRVRRHRRSRGPLRFRSFAKQVAFERLAGANSAASLWSSYAQGANRVGVEYAHPFMDRRLHELVFAMPLEQFFDRGLDRAVLRRALEGLVPDVVRLRVQQTYFDEWFETHPTYERLWEVVRSCPVPDGVPALSREALSRPEPPADAKRFRNQLIWLAIFLDWCKHVGTLSAGETHHALDEQRADS